MRKLSDYKNGEALDLLAELINPVLEIFADNEIVGAIRNGSTKISIIQKVIKTHKQSVIEILAILDGVPVEEYQCNIFTLPIKIMEIMNDKELKQFFILQSQLAKTNETSSGSAMENTEVNEK